MAFLKKRFGWVGFDLQISEPGGPTFSGPSSPNARGTALDEDLEQFRMSSSVPEIFGAEL